MACMFIRWKTKFCSRIALGAISRVESFINLDEQLQYNWGCYFLPCRLCFLRMSFPFSQINKLNKLKEMQLTPKNFNLKNVIQTLYSMLSCFSRDITLSGLSLRCSESPPPWCTSERMSAIHSQHGVIYIYNKAMDRAGRKLFLGVDARG